MYLNLSPATISIRNQSLSQLVTLATAYGFDGIDVPGEILQSRREAEEGSAIMAEAGLQWGIFWLPGDFSGCDDSAFREGMRKLQQILPLVQLAGCSRCYNHIWPGSHSLPYMANFRKHAARLGALADLLGRYGVTLGLEFIGAKTLRDEFRYPFIHTLEEALELADAASPAVGIVLDMYHLYTSGGSVDDLRRLLPVDRIVNVHANDAPAGRRREEQVDMEREMPLATGINDGRAIALWLHEVGYEGPVIAEPFAPATARFAAMSADAVAKEVGECLARLLATPAV